MTETAKKDWYCRLCNSEGQTVCLEQCADCRMVEEMDMEIVKSIRRAATANELADRIEAELRGEIFGTQETPLTEAEWRLIVSALRGYRD